MVELALDPSELDMDSDAMAVRYEQQVRENQSQLQKEDLSDMLAEHVAKQKVIQSLRLLTAFCWVMVIVEQAQTAAARFEIHEEVQRVQVLGEKSGLRNRCNN